MDAATLVMIVSLADGRPKRTDTPFETVEQCETFRAEAEARQPADIKIVESRCDRHYQVTK